MVKQTPIFYHQLNEENLCTSFSSCPPLSAPKHDHSFDVVFSCSCFCLEFQQILMYTKTIYLLFNFLNFIYVFFRDLL